MAFRLVRPLLALLAVLAFCVPTWLFSSVASAMTSAEVSEVTADNGQSANSDSETASNSSTQSDSDDDVDLEEDSDGEDQDGVTPPVIHRLSITLAVPSVEVCAVLERTSMGASSGYLETVKRPPKPRSLV